MFKLSKNSRHRRIDAKILCRYMGGVGVPSSYFGIANNEFTFCKKKIIEPSLIFLVAAGDASGKTTLIDNLIKKFTHDFDIYPVSKAPINPLELHDTIISNKAVFIDIHELNYEMFEWIYNVNSNFANDYGFIMIHPHVSMETYRRRVTDRLLNNSLELRFGITSQLFENDLNRHIICANHLFHIKKNHSNFLDISLIYENNTPDKEIINIFSKKYDHVYNSKLLEEVFNKSKLDMKNETKLTSSFYSENSPYNGGELDYFKLVELKEKNSSKNEISTPFFPKKLNDAINAICSDYLITCDKKLDKNHWFQTFDKFSTNLQL